MDAVPLVSLPGRFTPVRRIGEGAMGVVYEVWDGERQERMALKTLHKATPTDIREFKKEFRTVASISHPNLVALHELFFEDGLWFFTMELVEGEPLVQSERATRRRLTEKALRSHFLQLAEGICALHHGGVLHRDIKPDNVVVQPSGRVVLLDFGLVAELRSSLSYQDAEYGLAGSPAYMAPEQVLGQRLTPASDWYAFGVTLYEAISGALPFDDGRGSTVMKKLSGEARPLAELQPAVSAELAGLCSRLLARDPEQRPTASEILKLLGTPSSPPRPVNVEPEPYQSQRIVGRAVEREAIVSWLNAEKGNGPRIAILRGPSGIGKTTLARSVLSRLQKEGSWTLCSRCMPQEAVPFNAWDGTIDELRDALHRRESAQGPLLMDAALPRIFPVLGSLQGASAVWEDTSADPIEARTEGMRALRELLCQLCTERELHLFIDDVQWADADSLRLLDEMLAGSPAPGVTLVVTLRSDLDEPSDFERHLTDPDFAEASRVFDVGPLPSDDAATLLSGLGLRDGETRERVISEARGNPFLLSELARWGGTRSVHEAIRLSSVLRQRLDALPAEAQDLFEVVGLVGRPVPLDVALDAARVVEGAMEAVHRLRAAGLVRLGSTARNEIETYHDRWRPALSELMERSQRRARFEALAGAFERGNSEEYAEVLATCYRECGDHQAAARHALVAAGSAESTLAFERAARCYEMALELGEWNDDEQGELFSKLGVMAHAAGRGARAGRAFRRAAAFATGQERIGLLRRAARSLLSSGRTEDGEAVLREVLRAVGRGVPKTQTATIALLLWERWRLARRGLRWEPRPLSEPQRVRLAALDVAASTWVVQDPIAAWVYTYRQLRLALDGDDERALLRAVSYQVILAASDFKAASHLDELCALGARLCESVQDPTAVAWFRHAVGMRALLAGEWLEAERALADAAETLRTRCTAVHWELCLARQRYVAAVQIVGDMAKPEAELRDWLEDAERRDDRESIATHLFGLGYCELSKGRPERVWPLIERVRELVEDEHAHGVGASWLEALTLCYQGASSVELWASLQRVRKVHKTMQSRVLFYRVWSRAYEVRLLGALALTTEGQEREIVVDDMRRTRKLLLKDDWHYAAATAGIIDAFLHGLAGDMARAAQVLDDVGAQHEKHGARLFAAVSRLTSARLRSHAADEQRALDALHEIHVVDPEGLSRAHLPLFY